MRGREIFQYRQAFAEVRLNRRFDDLAVRLTHQTSHTSQLANLFFTTTSTGICHQEHRIHIAGSTTVILFHGIHHLGRDRFTSVRPGIQNLVVTFLIGNHSTLVVLAVFQHFFLGGGNNLFLGFRCHQVIGGKRQSTTRRLAETQLVHIIQQGDRFTSTQSLVTIGNDCRQATAFHWVVIEVHPVGQDHVEHDTTVSGFDDRIRMSFLFCRTRLLAFRQAHFNLGVHVNDALRVRQVGFVQRREHHAFTRTIWHHQRDEVTTHHRILRRTHDRAAIGRCENIVRRHHQRVSFDLGFDRKRQVNRHLVTVKVSIESFADQWMQVDRIALDQYRLERLDTHSVKRRSTIQQDRVILDHFLQDIPNLFVLALQHLLGALDRIGVALLFQLANDEWLEQFQSNLLRQTTLVQFQSRTHHDDRTSGIIDTLTKQVFTETTLLTLNHIGQRLQRSVTGPEHWSFATIVVEQSVDRLLQHSLLVANDDFRSVQIDQFSQTVVAVNDTTIEIIQITRRKVP